MTRDPKTNKRPHEVSSQVTDLFGGVVDLEARRDDQERPESGGDYLRSVVEIKQASQRYLRHFLAV